MPLKRLHVVTDPVSANRPVGSNIGASAPGRDWLGFGVDAEFQPLRVAEWLKLGTEDLARLTDAPLIEVAVLCNLVAEVFDGDLEKAQAWFQTVNPMLGDMAPLNMIRLGRFERLRKFIKSALQGQ